jgi:hypothetical protein
MAQTGFTPIQLYSTSTAAAVPLASNLTNSTLGSELAINITDGKLFYKDNANAVQVIGWKTVPTTAGGTGLTVFTANQVFYASSTSAIGQSANLTFNGTTLTTTGISTSNNLTFTGTSNRIIGDFSNATASNRVAFQSSTTNGNTGVYIIPNGTATTGNLTISNNSAPDNSSIAQLFATSADVRFASTALGTGTNLPLTIYTAGSERIRVFTSGGVSIGNTTDPGATNLSVSGTTNTASGNQSALNATATTIYTMPTLPQGLYVVQAALGNNAPATFTAVSLITQGNGTSRATALATATNMTISVSGLNIQATQSAGGTATIAWTVFRIA